VRVSAGAALVAMVAILSACNPSEPPHDNGSAIVWRVGPHLPSPVTDNAVAALETNRGPALLSFGGMGPSKRWDGITDAVYRWQLATDGWTEAAPVPGGGRLGSTAQVVRGKVYLLGGYTVEEDGSRRSSPRVDIYDPSTDAWARGPDMPMAVHDALGGVWRDSLIVLVSGWHDSGGIDDVQWYDPAAARWFSGTPIEADPALGMAGAVVGDRIVYTDGILVRPERESFAMDTASWIGKVDPNDPTSISWRALPDHPGPVVYRAASGSVGALALFVGGTGRPYDFNGIGFDGEPAEPIRQALSYSPASGEWRHLPAPPLATMDHRTLGVVEGTVYLVGGMEVGQRVSDKVWYANIDELLARR